MADQHASRRSGFSRGARRVVIALALSGGIAVGSAAASTAVSSTATAVTAVVNPMAAAGAHVVTAGRPVLFSALPAAPTPAPSPSAPAGVSVTVDGGNAGRSQAVSIIVLMTVLSVAPALLLMCTSFTKIAIVLSLTRNALGTPTIPPNQVLAGIALFLSLFVMSPVLSQVNDQGVQPYLQGKITEQQAFDRGSAPLKTFMLKQTGPTELQTMIKLSKEAQPAKREDVSLSTLIPAFVLSEIKSAFIIGFVIFIPFLVIDLVVSSALMSMGMMMLPPVMISLPFKLLLFVLVDGWSLITTALVASYQ